MAYYVNAWHCVVVIVLLCLHIYLLAVQPSLHVASRWTSPPANRQSTAFFLLNYSVSK